MRLLSIFALLFLISLALHNSPEEWTVPQRQAGEETEDVEAIPAAEEDFSPLVFGQPYPVRHFDFGLEHNFSIIEIELKNLIVGWNNDSFKVRNHFCAVGYEFQRNLQDRRRGRLKKEVVVYWREGKILYRWTGGDPKAAEKDFYHARSLMFSRSIPLDPDLLEGRDEDIVEGPLSYKERAGNTIADCEKHGKSYTIEPFAPPPRGFRPPRKPASPPPAPPSPPEGGRRGGAGGE